MTDPSYTACCQRHVSSEEVLAAQRGGLAGLVMAESGVPYSVALMTTLNKCERVKFSSTGAWLAIK